MSLDILGVVQCTVASGDLPALIVVHDDEGDWLVGDGINDPNEDGACGLYHLVHLLSMDPSLAEAFSIGDGFYAARDSLDSAWHVSRWHY